MHIIYFCMYFSAGCGWVRGWFCWCVAFWLMRQNNTIYFHLLNLVYTTGAQLWAGLKGLDLIFVFRELTVPQGKFSSDTLSPHNYGNLYFILNYTHAAFRCIHTGIFRVLGWSSGIPYKFSDILYFLLWLDVSTTTVYNHPYYHLGTMLFHLFLTILF